MNVQMNDECLYLFSSAFITMNYLIIAILSSEKCNDENFVKWKSNLNIILICKNYKFVLTEECPPKSLLVLYEKHMIVGFKPITKHAATC